MRIVLAYVAVGIFVGLMGCRRASPGPQQSCRIDVRDFGARGDGLADDTNAITRALAAAVGRPNVEVFFSPGDYLITGVEVLGARGMKLVGNRVRLVKHPKAIGEPWSNSAALLTLVACRDVSVSGFQFDGNRRALPRTNKGMNMGILVLPDRGTRAGEFFRDNHGSVKPTQRISIVECGFRGFGTYRDGLDKWGDGIYAFAASEMHILNCTFTNVGRWAVAGSDLENLTIRDCIIENIADGDEAIALGAFDFEQESSDTLNGSTSAGIVVDRCILRGRSAIQLNAACSDFNAPAKIAVRGVKIRDCSIAVDPRGALGGTALGINVAAADARKVSLEQIEITGNTFHLTDACVGSSAIKVYAHGRNIDVADISIRDNVIIGRFDYGISLANSGGPVYSRLSINDNVIRPDADFSGIAGITLHGTWYNGVYITKNFIRSCTTGIRVIEDVAATTVLRITDNMVVEADAKEFATGIEAKITNVESGGNIVRATNGKAYTFGSGLTSGQDTDVAISSDKKRFPR